MTIRQKALDAAGQADTNLRQRARDALTSFGLSWQADGLEVVTVDFAHDRAVVTDAAGSVQLGIDAPPDGPARIFVVEVDAQGRVTRVGRPLADLAELGRALKGRG